VTDPELALLSSLSGGAGLTLAGVIRWAVGLWATIRREDIAAQKEAAALKRAADERNVDRHIATVDRIAALVDEHTAKDLAAQAEVKQAVVRLEAKLDATLDWRERTPVGDEPGFSDRPASERRRGAARTAPRGYRSPRSGEPDTDPRK
jgi:hypothetical protein